MTVIAISALAALSIVSALLVNDVLCSLEIHERRRK